MLFILLLLQACSSKSKIKSKNRQAESETDFGIYPSVSNRTLANRCKSTEGISAVESTARLFEPRTIHFNEAIMVAILGLAVNFLRAVLLKERHDSDHEHGHADDHHHTHDHNPRGAYLHVLADEATTALAIVALCFGKYFGWDRLDPLTGISGAVLIARWSYGQGVNRLTFTEASGILGTLKRTMGSSFVTKNNRQGFRQPSG